MPQFQSGLQFVPYLHYTRSDRVIFSDREVLPPSEIKRFEFGEVRAL